LKKRPFYFVGTDSFAARICALIFGEAGTTDCARERVSTLAQNSGSVIARLGPGRKESHNEEHNSSERPASAARYDALGSFFTDANRFSRSSVRCLIRYSVGEASAAIMILETEAPGRGGAESLPRCELQGAYDEMFGAVDPPRKQYHQQEWSQFLDETQQLQLIVAAVAVAK